MAIESCYSLSMRYWSHSRLSHSFIVAVMDLVGPRLTNHEAPGYHVPEVDALCIPRYA